MHFLNDEYTLNIDDLGYKKQVDIIRDLTLNANTPFSFGISGRWGSGKTSIMKYLMASLGGEPLKHRIKFQASIIREDTEFSAVFNNYKTYKDCEHIETIWFNPWENENHAEPMIGLLQEIHSHFSSLSKIGNSVRKYATVSIQAGLDLLSALKNGSGHQVGTNINNIGEKYEYDNFE